MKSVTFICCIIICSFFSLVACKKQSAPPPKYAPGDSLLIIGGTDNDDETALLYSGNGNISQPDFPAFTALGKELDGTDNRTRSIMKFRLKDVYDSLSANLPQIKKAVLYLYQYNNPTDADLYATQQNADNGLELHRVAGYWQASTVTWHTQPALAEGSANPLADVITIPPITTPLPAGTNDDLVIDVTAMLQEVFENRDNKGFLLKLTNEAVFAGRSFGSFTCPDVSKHPKLMLYF